MVQVYHVWKYRGQLDSAHFHVTCNTAKDFMSTLKVVEFFSLVMLCLAIKEGYCRTVQIQISQTILGIYRVSI